MNSRFVLATVASLGLGLSSIQAYAGTTTLLNLSVDPTSGTISYGTSPVQTYQYFDGIYYPVSNGVGYVNTFTYTGTFAPVTITPDPTPLHASFLDVVITFDAPLVVPIPTTPFNPLSEWQIVRLSVTGPNFPQSEDNNINFGGIAPAVNEIRFTDHGSIGSGGPWDHSDFGVGCCGPGIPSIYNAQVVPIAEISDAFYVYTPLFANMPGSVTVDSFTITVQVAAAAPEPATWAMMLIGFAGLGFAFRQSRRNVAMA